MDNIWKIKNFMDNYFGNSILYQDKNSGKLYIKKIILTDNKIEKNKIINYLKIRLKKNHKNVIKIYNYEVNKIKKFCNEYYKIYVLYKYPENFLISLYKSENEFNHELLTHLLYQILNGLNYFEKIKYPFNKWNLNNISYKIKNGSYYFKLIDAGDFSVFDEIKINLFHKKEIISNEYLLKHYYKLNTINQEDLFKNDVYSLALIILKLGIKKDLKDLIDFNLKKFKLKKLKEFIEIFKNKYEKTNKFLVILLINLLKEETKSSLILKKIPVYKKFWAKIKNINIYKHNMKEKKTIRLFKFGDDINLYKKYKENYSSNFKFKIKYDKLINKNSSLNYINLNKNISLTGSYVSLNYYNYSKKINIIKKKN